MSVIKPRKGFQGTADSTSELASISGRTGYKVLVKDVGVFEWVASATADSVNVFAGASGYWSRIISSGTAAKVYRALLTQTSTGAPVAVVLENGLSGTVVWAYSSPGVYTATLVGEFVADKTIARINVNTAAANHFGVVRTSADVLTLTTLNASAVATDALLVSTPIEIVVYP